MTNYREVKAINKSSMDTYEDAYQDFVNWWVNNVPIPSRSEDFFNLGSAIDVLITRPKDYENEFTVFRGTAPTGQMMSFCNALAELSKATDAPLPVSTFYQSAYDKVGIKGSKLETVAGKFEGSFIPYYEFLTNTGGKTALSLEQAAKAAKIVEEVKENRFTSPFVNVQNDDDNEVWNQLEIYTSYRDIPLKGALDRVLINHKKQIVQPIDFKSSSNIIDFQGSYYKYRYYRQGSYYTYLLERWLQEKGYKGYKILPFLFVVYSTTGGQHWCYRMTEKDLADARFGGETPAGRQIKGWEDILKEIDVMGKWNEWAFPYEVHVNHGIIPLNIFK